MKEEIKSKKQCQNCRYYSQHYSKRDTSYSTVECGHCLNQNNKKMELLRICEYWEDIAIKKEARKKKIKDVLTDMSKSLEQIAMILKDDKDDE